MNVTRYFLIILAVFVTCNATGVVLEKGSLYQEKMPETLEGYKEYYLSHSLPGNSFAYYKYSSSDNSYYTLSREAVLYDVVLIPKTPKSFFVNKTIVNKWPLTRWPYLQRPIEILKQHAVIGESEWKYKIRYTSRKPYAGCLNRSPLRYGDIEEDGQNELVLTLNGELIIFSPENERTVFATLVQADDWYREPFDESQHESDVHGGVFNQYLSSYLMYNGVSDKAHRGYTKLYVGDFDNDGNSDVVTWRKLYASNEVGEQPGFHLLRNTYRHFERDLKAQEESEQGITGEYLPQETEEETVQQWLADNNLTWTDGYPSKSECQGEEGRLIPEMHDPLLNDPEVLPVEETGSGAIAQPE